MKEKAVKPQKLLNISTEHEIYDTLHTKANTKSLCNQNLCKGSLMVPSRAGNEPRPKEEVLTMAKQFFDEYYQSLKSYQSDEHNTRWDQVSSSIQENGSYEHSETELIFGAKMAWRNAPRCIGRIQWSKLQLFDCRNVTTARGMFDSILTHIKFGTNEGNIRSAITIFPKRTDAKHDFRVWNSQFLSYAGYRNSDGSITGDPINVPFTEICQKLGWKGLGTKWDILPLILSADGEDPEWFEIPRDYVLEVQLSHPAYKWFAELNIKWYCLPAVSNMLFDCGGLEFPAAPFNGWYMSSEIATRNLCDSQRLNILEQVGQEMGLVTDSNINLWKDKAVVEINVAVLHSFQQKNITIVDHHTASESFIQHMDNEQRLRGGCPADWIWIVPPISGSITPVFHQEMSLYYLKPSYEYQKAAWTTHVWKLMNKLSSIGSSKRRYKFKEIAWIVIFTSYLYRKALKARITATILYATETGKSEKFAKKVEEIFGYAFNSQVHCMSDYDVSKFKDESLVLIVTSTFGKGDPPENGESFAKYLNTMRDECSNGNTLMSTKFSVFALGSTSYPNFCEFGKHTDKLLSDLGAQRLVPLVCGDEISGQEQNFNRWAADVFKMGCETFSLKNESLLSDVTSRLQEKSVISADQFKLIAVDKESDLTLGLSKTHGRKLHTCVIKSTKNLHGENINRWTQQVIMNTNGIQELNYQPGDHISIVPANKEELVNELLEKYGHEDISDQPVQLMVLKKTRSINGLVNSWEPDERLPECSVRTLLTRYLDITTPPTPTFLMMLANLTTNNKQRTRLEQLASKPQEYEEWKNFTYSHLPEIFTQFPSVQIPLAFLLSQLPTLKMRFYSISSASELNMNEIHLTVGVVVYKTKYSDGPLHFGVSSNYLKNVTAGDAIHCFIRKAFDFHLPDDPKKPIILVGPGTGIAPFRSFWQHRLGMIQNERESVGELSLFFGCRTRQMDIYHNEKNAMVNLGVITRNYLALSREPSLPKIYVQDLLETVGNEVYHQIVTESGHFYVCGDSTMASCVYQKLKQIIKEQGQMMDQDVEDYMAKMKQENRYHEDIFNTLSFSDKIPRTKRLHNMSSNNKTRLHQYWNNLYVFVDTFVNAPHRMFTLCHKQI